MAIRSQKREPHPGTYRPGDRIEFGKSAEASPFDYGSDLHWLWGWGARLHSLVASDVLPSRHDWMIFRPDGLARNAMMRLSIKYPHVIKQVDEYLDFLEKSWTEFSDDAHNACKPSAWNFSTHMDKLTERIRVACETIAAAESGPPSKGNPPSTIPPGDRTIPMSYRRAAKLMGKGDSQDAAEWLSKSVGDGAIPCEHYSRQTHVFSRQWFPQSVWPQIVPK